MPTNTLWFLNLSVSGTTPGSRGTIWDVLNPRCRDTGIASPGGGCCLAAVSLHGTAKLLVLSYLIIIHKILTKFTTGFPVGKPTGFSAECSAGFPTGFPTRFPIEKPRNTCRIFYRIFCKIYYAALSTEFPAGFL